MIDRSLASKAAPSRERIAVSDPWVARLSGSQLLRIGEGPASPETISLVDHEVYEDPRDPIAFRIGNGGAGYTGVLRMLAESYIVESGNKLRIGWVSNHSRHSQIALLADVVQVALTYEPQNEELAIREGWTRRVGRAFNDHFMLAGPADVQLKARTVEGALKEIAMSHTGFNSKSSSGRELLFHSRGDGSATFVKETRLWQAANIHVASTRPNWISIDPLTPYEALAKANKEQAFLITDRSTFLTALQDGVVSCLTAYIEGGQELLNPCSVLVRSQSTTSSSDDVDRYSAAVKFAEWLTMSTAQGIIERYGRDWKAGHALFTIASKDDFDEKYLLSRTTPARARRGSNHYTGNLLGK